MTTGISATLGDVCQINPRPLKGSLPPRDTPVSFVAMADVDENVGDITNRQERLISEVERGYTPFEEGDVLFAKITPRMENGKAAIARNLVNGRGFGSTEFYVLRPTNRVLADYVYHFVRQSSFRAVCKANFSGSVGQQRVPRQFLSRIPLPVPPLDEQRRIIDILNHAASIRRLREQAQAKAREIIPALFLDMFGDPAENPRSWKTVCVAEVLERSIRNGISPSRRGKNVAEVLTLSAITGTRFDASAKKEGTFEAPIAAIDEVDARDFLICRGNGNVDLVGRGKFPIASMPGVAFPDTVMALRPNPKLVKLDVLAALWETDHVRRQIKCAARTTSGTYKINQRNANDIEIILPSMDEQTLFVNRVAELRSVALLLQQQADIGERLAPSLMYGLFRGKHP